MLHPAVALFQLAVIALVGRTFASFFPSLRLNGGLGSGDVENSKFQLSRQVGIFLDVFSCFTAGAAVLSLAFALVGFLRFDAFTMTGIALVLAIPGFINLLRGGKHKVAGPLGVPRSIPPGQGLPNAIAIMAVTICAALALWGCFAPEVRSDAVIYHLRIPRLWLNFGRIVDLPEQGLSYYPYGYELLYGWSLSLGSDSAAKVLHWAAGVSAAGWCARLGAKNGLRGADCAAIFYLLPMIQSLSTTSYVDLATVMYGLAALTLFLENLNPAQSDDEKGKEDALANAGEGIRPAILFGLIAGSAIATKYPAWPILGTVLGVAGLVRYATRRKMLFGFAAFASLAAVPWVVRNLIHTGNPVAPLLIDRLGPQSAMGSELANLMGFHAGQGRDWAALLLAPVGLVRHLATENYPIGLLGPPAGLVMILLMLTKGRHAHAPAPLRWIPFFVLGLFATEAYSTFGHPSARYGLTTMGLGGVCVVALADQFSQLTGKRRLYAIIPVLIALSFVNVLASRHQDRLDLGETLGPIWGAEDRVAYLTEQEIAPPYFTEIEFHLEREDCDRVLGWGYPSVHKSWVWYLGIRNDLVREAGGENARTAQIEKSLRTAGITHIAGGSNPGFDAERWKEFITEFTDESGPAEWRLRRIR